MTNDDARTIVAAIAETWPSRYELSPTAIELQARALGAIEFVHALAALEKLVATSKFRPSIAELIEQSRLVARETEPRCKQCGLVKSQCASLRGCDTTAGLS